MKRTTKSFLLLIYVFLSAFFAQQTAVAATRSKIPVSRPTPAHIVINANTGTILHQHNAHMHAYPASLTKMMTIYITFEAIKQGKLDFDTRLPISKYAASRPKSNINLRAGETIKVRELILSLIVKSANDSATVLAEGIAGSESNFARIMTRRAQQLGMHSTSFYNASGWHHPQQKTTAVDMAKLAIALKRDYPEHYHLFSRTSFYYKNTKYKGHNRVVENLQGAEGMKTGYTGPAGFNLVTTAKRGDTRLVGVVLGSESSRIRDTKMMQLLNHHFDKIQGTTTNKPVAIIKVAKTSSKKTLASKRNKSKLHRVNAKAHISRKTKNRTA